MKLPWLQPAALRGADPGQWQLLPADPRGVLSLLTLVSCRSLPGVRNPCEVGSLPGPCAAAVQRSAKPHRRFPAGAGRNPQPETMGLGGLGLHEPLGSGWFPTDHVLSLVPSELSTRQEQQLCVRVALAAARPGAGSRGSTAGVRLPLDLRSALPGKGIEVS